MIGWLTERTGTPLAAALYRQAEIYRARGDFEAAEDAYREASQWGHEPQPGLALLRLAEGNPEAAARSIRRVADVTTDRLRRAKVLPAHVEIMLAIGDVRPRGTPPTNLPRSLSDYATPALLATADGSQRGRCCSPRATPAAPWPLCAVPGTRWRELDAPYEAARVQVLLALSCRALGDEDSAALELDAAHRVFSDLGAAPDVSRVEQLAAGADPSGGSRVDDP